MKLMQWIKLLLIIKKNPSPRTATKTYVSNLIDYNPEDVIKGDFPSEYNEDLTKKYLNMLQLNNLNIYFITNLFRKDCGLTEKYFGTKYSKEKITITEEEINSYKYEYLFDYPPVNEFIPKNFDLLPPPEKISKYPEKIKSHKNMEVWYLQDTSFKVPKAYLGAQFITPIDLCDFSVIKIIIISKLLDQIIKKELGELLYSARKSKFNLNFSLGITKSIITFGGFSDSLKKGTKSILNMIKNLDLNNERYKETIEIVKRNLLSTIKNNYFAESHKVNTQYVIGLMNEPYKNPEDIINFFKEKEITIEDLIVYKNAFFKSSKSKWLIQGNISKETALEIVEEAYKIFEIDINQEKIGKLYIKRPIVIKKNYNYIFRKKVKI